MNWYRRLPLFLLGAALFTATGACADEPIAPAPTITFDVEDCDAEDMRKKEIDECGDIFDSKSPKPSSKRPPREQQPRSTGAATAPKPGKR